MTPLLKKGRGGSGGGGARVLRRGLRPLGKRLRLQAVSFSCFWSADVGPARRRLAASFSGGLARSFAQRGSADRKWVADRSSAASLRDRVSVVAQASAAWGGVGGGEMFEGTGKRASQRRCLALGNEGAGDAGDGLAPRSR